MQPGPSKPGKLETLLVGLRRSGAIILTLGLTVAAAAMFGSIAVADGFDWVDVVRITLVAFCALWLSWGACTAVLGLIFGAEKVSSFDGTPSGRTAIVIPVYNEAADAVFARLDAMYRALNDLGVMDTFDFHVLSDSTRPEAQADEKRLHRRAVAALGAGGRLFYRHRSPNTGRKAGNISEFIRTNGGAYDYMLVLDADSLMKAETIVEMVRRMEAAPDLGLLQTVPLIIGRKTLFGRMIQFSASFYSPLFSRGVAALQGRQGPFWGHNALIRMRAFAETCGLPSLAGKPPFGGDILSHDTVEAAMLARGGWRVRLDPDLGGSYEEAPANLIEYAKRDRRWCQGNLQHARLLGAPKLKFWSRLNIIQGIFGYIASPIWLMFLVASVAAPLFAPPPVYFMSDSLFPRFPHPETEKGLALLFGVVALLILPKALLLARAVMTGDDGPYGGSGRASLSALLELLLASLLAPIHMMFQSRSVYQVLTGADFGWPSSEREDGSLDFVTAWKASWWMVLFGIGTMLFAHYFAPALVVWLWPVAVPLVLAPVIIWWTASPKSGLRARNRGVFLTPQEWCDVPVISAAARALDFYKSEPGEPAREAA
ncbi:membrane glycosyltransferase [Breoghania corrubedonensis]|uniref:Glucans biosynthesis glucosyltransferase H n=1 Tax=Breoghania corrubedonensis TaxID=665038 RepID=A0A2T5VCH7_9HYPH|nr:glucans biosynthesis glucosyltransferase MdoH [Breoghania corrubedonensis]PTW61444.1 membrane glycosyltransferase [Breoghania corrubedonensis]